ncbi:hypothetical protein [Desulfopila inferna]|uniref:hypothetical protein n=1 Tax=Desulfopila inferna TaxID=468528 RepID=UPI001966BE9F|nr:hypothetical protein [Desulfopila inferna]MBM9602674.1 hypothetical protein [Desulfopila inferna]
MKISYAVLVFVCAFLLTVVEQGQAEELDDENLKLQISFDVKNESLRNVLQSISAETGYRIEVNKELLDIKVSGSFKDTTLTAIISRILKGNNVFIVEDNSKKLLSVRSIASAPNQSMEIFNVDQDEGSPGDLIIEVKLAQASLDKNILNNQDTIEASPGVSYRSFINSRDELDQYMVDNATQIMATSSGSYAELKETQDQLDQHINNGNVEASENFTHRELLVEQAELDTKISSDNKVEASPGMSYQELKKIQAQLDKQLAKRKK